jgi:hypothetical protein
VLNGLVFVAAPNGLVDDAPNGFVVAGAGVDDVPNGFEDGAPKGFVDGAPNGFAAVVEFELNGFALDAPKGVVAGVDDEDGLNGLEVVALNGLAFELNEFVDVPNGFVEVEATDGIEFAPNGFVVVLK